MRTTDAMIGRNVAAEVVGEQIKLCFLIRFSHSPRAQ